MISISSILIAKPELVYPEAMRSSLREHQRTATFHKFIRMRGLWLRSGKPASGRFILGMLLAFFIFSPAIAHAQVAISTTALPAGNTSNTYNATLSATGGTAPYTWALTSGTLPAGLSLSSAGVIKGVATSITSGTPPVPAQFTVQVTDSAALTASQAFSIAVLAPGSHSLVINQIFDGGNGSSSSPYPNNYIEVFNASSSPVDLQNWTVQIAASTSAFSQTGAYPLGSLDAYKIGTTGGSDSLGDYPAYQITYSAAFAAHNCNPAAANSAFPASHCWLNPGQFMLVLLGTSSSTGALTNLPTVLPDLDLTDGYINGVANSLDTGAVLSNVGAVTTSSSSIWVGHGVTTANENTYIAKPNPSNGMMALVYGVGVGVSCQPGLPSNPKPSAVISPLASDFIAYFAQVTAGTTGGDLCWEGQSNVTIGGPGLGVTTPFIAGGAFHVSSSLKNTEALIRSAGNGIINPTVSQATNAYPAGTVLSTSAVLTPCGDTDNNLTDFAPILNGAKGQSNWVLHNSQLQVTAATITSPVSYSPTPCATVSNSGPLVTATFNQPALALGTGGGSVTDMLTVKVTPSVQPTTALFNVNVNLSGVAGATTTAPITASSVGVPDGNGNYLYQEPITLPTTTTATYTFPVTIYDDAFRGGQNANYSNPLNAQVVVGLCQAPLVTSRTVQMGWNSAQSLTLTAQLGGNCSVGDTLVYAIQSQPTNGTLSAVSGSSLTYTPRSGFAGQDSFTYNVTDTSNPLGPVISATATVTLVVSATGVLPTLNLNCPSAVYTGNAMGCTAAPTPFVAGTTTITYNGSTTAPTNAGSYPVIASFVSTATNPSQNTSANATLAIGQANPTLTLTCLPAVYDGAPQGCTASVSGIGAAAPQGSIGIAYNGSAAQPSNQGVYPVVATFTSTDPNYTSATASSSLTISEPTLTITVNSATLTYGAASPSFTYTVVPSVPLQTAPVCVSTATSASAVGTYAGAITCSGATKTGCNFVYVPGNMTILPAIATVTANNQTMTSGTALPALTFATSPSALAFNTSPICTTTATSTSPVATYQITCAGGVAANYNLNYVAGTMTVTVAPTIPNGIPTLTSTTPMTIPAGSPNLTVTVNGSSFVAGATVLWNGSARATTFVSSTQLTATILAADLTTVGTAEIRVMNPAPGGGYSASQTFSIDSVALAQGAFTVALSNASVSVTRGQSWTTYLAFSNLQPGAIASAVCYNLPASANCSFDDGTLTIGAAANTLRGTYPVLVVCNTSGTLTSSNRIPNSTILCGFLALPLGLLTLYRSKRRRLFGLCTLSMLLMSLLLVGVGCGGSSAAQKSPVVSAQVSTSITLTIK